MRAMATSSRILVLMWLAVHIEGRRHTAEDALGVEATGSASAGGAFSPKPLMVAVLMRTLPAGAKSRPRTPQFFEPALLPAPGREPTELAARASGPARTDDGGPRPGRTSRFLGRLRGLEAKAGQSLVGRWAKWKLIPQERLDNGSSNEVWKATLATRTDNREVAVKLERLGRGRGAEEARAQAMREAAVMERFSGGRFLEYLGWWERRNRFMDIMEVADGNLKQLVIDQPFEAVDLFERVELFTELVDGLRILEEQGFVHRRITPQNVMIKRDEDGLMHVKIADVGMACKLHAGAAPQGCDVHETTPSADRVPAPAPETLSALRQTDIFDAGLILYQLVFEGNLPDHLTRQNSGAVARDAWLSYDVTRDRRLAAALAAVEEPRDSWLGGLLDVLEAMLLRDPEWRLDAATVHEALLELVWQERDSSRILYDAARGAL